MIRPDSKELARESTLFLEDPVRFDISVDLYNDSVYMYYDTTVICADGASSWEGQATVYWNDVYFTQECRSLQRAEKAYKQWRGNWVLSRIKDPTDLLEQWLQDISNGYGIYERKPVKISGIDDSLSSLSGEAYSIVLLNRQLDWDCLCDAEPDTMFGGESLLTDFQTVNVLLLFDMVSETLRAVFITSEQNWLEATIIVNETETIPIVDFESLAISDGILSEEWSMKTIGKQ